MRFPYSFILFFSVVSFSQEKLLEFQIDSISTTDSKEERKFKLHYHLTNRTGKQLHFFFRPDCLVPNIGGSMSNCPYYKIYEGDKFLNLGIAFDRTPKGVINNRVDVSTPEKRAEVLKDYSRSFVVTDSMAAQFMRDGHFSQREFLSDSLMEEFKQGRYHTKPELRKLNPMEDVFTLEPKETKTFSKTFYWDKDRYFFNDPEEFYLSETEKHYIEFTLVLLKEAFKDKLSEADYNQIMADPNFIKGVYFSNKEEISFNQIKNPSN